MTQQLDNSIKTQVDKKMRMTTIEPQAFNPNMSSDEDEDENNDFMAADFDRRIGQSFANADGRQSEMRRTGIKKPTMKVLSQSEVKLPNKEEKKKDDNDEGFDHFANFEQNMRNSMVSNLYSNNSRRTNALFNDKDGKGASDSKRLDAPVIVKPLSTPSNASSKTISQFTPLPQQMVTPAKEKSIDKKDTFAVQQPRIRSPVNIDSNGFNNRMLKDMYKAVSQITEEPEDQQKDVLDDELSDLSDIEYKNYSMQSALEEALLSKLKLDFNFKTKLNKLKQEAIDNQSQLSEEDFILDHYQNMHYETLAESSSPYLKRKATKLLEKQKDEDWEDKDKISMVDWNERRHQEVAREQLKENSVISLKNVQVQKVPLKLVSDFTIMQRTTNHLIAGRQYHNVKATCIAVSDDLIFIGNSEGSLMMFDRETEEEYHIFSEKSKEFLGNIMTAIDVHPTRTEYVICGYEKGQMVLLDVTEPKKSLKVIKDHHKGIPISNLKFCDWKGKRAQDDQDIPQSGASNDDKQIWMFVSIDADGKVIVNSVKKVVFMFQSSKHVIIDPNKVNAPMFSSVATRFELPMYAQNDQQIDGCIIALGNTETVYILKIRPNFHAEMFRIDRPQKYQSKKDGKMKDIKAKLPSLCWGYGHTPQFKDKSYSILAIGWGPLIQLVVINDLREKEQAFHLEGYYLLKPNVSQHEYLMLKYERKQAQAAKYEKMKKPVPADEDDDEKYQNNESVIYAINSLSIEQIAFLSESTLMVMTSELEIRILFTELFYPKKYQSNSIGENPQNYKDKDGNKREPVLEKGIQLQGVANSEHGATYHQTLKFHNGLALVMTEKGLYKAFQFTWTQSLIEFKKIVLGDWIQVFAKALEFYRGKIKGFLGVPEDPDLRENSMKADLKLLIRDIISEMVAKFNVLSTRTQLNAVATIGGLPQYQLMDDSQADIKEHLRLIDSLQDKKIQNYQTLIRIAIEFCVELNDCYFLFYDLFLMFQEEKMEKAFIEELEPFIIAGMFTEWELPVDILQNHIINFYKDHSHPENLEKVIINLNLSSCPKPVISELIHFSEQHFLSTAILFLKTQVFERKDDTCIAVLLALHSLYLKAGKVNEGSAKDISQIKGCHPSSDFHRQIEKSQAYIGYKILWIIKLFLGGKKFPNGNIKEAKWRIYIQDIMLFITNKQFLTTLLQIDAEAFFQIISVLFFEGRPCELVNMGRESQHIPGQQYQEEKSIGHIELLKLLDEHCSQSQNEDIRLQYLFFAANVASKCKVKQDQTYYFKLAKELLKNHTKYLKFNEHLLVRGMERRGLMKQMSYKEKHKVPDGVKHILKSEDDMLGILKLCEPMTDTQVIELQKLADVTKLQYSIDQQLLCSNQAMIYLLVKQEEYLKCLQRFLGGMKVSEVYSSAESKAKVFQWIKEKMEFLQQKSSKSGKDLKLYEQFKKEITQNIKQMIELCPHNTVLLIDEKFTQNHKEVIDSLYRDPQEQLKYLEALLKIKEKTIQETIREYSLQSSNPQEAKKYMEFMKQHLRLCCQLKTDYVIQIIEELVKQHYYPTDECLKICQEFKQTEACALLSKKLGKYYESVQQYLLVMKEKVNMKLLKYELHEAKQRNWPTLNIQNDKLMPQCYKVDSILRKVTKICKKNSKEVDIGKEELIWYEVLDTLFKLKQNEIIAKKRFCREFFEKRINLFTIELVGYIPFKNFLEKFAAKQKDVKFSDLKGVLFDIFSDFKSEKIILKDVKNSIFAMDTDSFKQFNMNSGQGILFRGLRCQLCKKLVDGSYDYQQAQQTMDEIEDQGYDTYDVNNDQVRLFACRHTFHDRCVNRFYQLRQKEQDLKRAPEQQKCPECNKKNFEIDMDKNKSPTGKLASQKSSESGSMMESNNSTDDSSRMDKNSALQRAEQSLKRKLVKVQKKMEAFDQTMECDCVTSLNFKRQEYY